MRRENSWPGSTHQSSQPQRQGPHPHQLHGFSHARYTPCLAPAHRFQPLWLPQKPTEISLDLGSGTEVTPGLARLPVLHMDPQRISILHSTQNCLSGPLKSLHPTVACVPGNPVSCGPRNPGPGNADRRAAGLSQVDSPHRAQGVWRGRQ